MSNIKKLFSNFILLSALCVLLGLFFIIWPEGINNVISYIIGGVIILVGIMDISRFLMTSGDPSALGPVVIIRGIIFSAVGLFLILKPDFVFRVISFVFGIYMLASGSLSLYDAMRIRKHNNGEGWQATAVMASLTVIIGLVMLFAPFTQYVVLGVMLVISGLTNVIGALSGKKKVEKVLGITMKDDNGGDDSGDRKFIDVK